MEGQLLERAERNSKRLKENNACLMCGNIAEFAIRGVPENKYCQPCAEESYGLLDYLDKIER